jgi:3-deoxy-D-manno-octulosonic-acid transferase
MYNDYKIKSAYKLYSLAWRAAIPILKFNKRFTDGWSQRTSGAELPSADLWIQAASVGESYLAREILNNIKPYRKIKVLLTTNTSQGMEILESSIEDIREKDNNIFATAAYFPFDSPSVMREAVSRVRPEAMILLETEIWPGLIKALKEHGSKIFIINGRITEKSIKRYMKLSWLLGHLAPDEILATTEYDAERFRRLFTLSSIDIMPNIKFDRISSNALPDSNIVSLDNIVSNNLPFVVLASVRQEEEEDIVKIIEYIVTKYTSAVIGLFPRHKQRVRVWEEILRKKGFTWKLRSKLRSKASSGTIILWDTFGELTAAYNLATSAFVGGSLKPLGGQNFLEAVSCGIVPVIGPFWDNFLWVGEEAFKIGLVKQATSWKGVARIILNDLNTPPSREKIFKKGLLYIKERQGGTEIACRLIENVL